VVLALGLVVLGVAWWVDARDPYKTCADAKVVVRETLDIRDEAPASLNAATEDAAVRVFASRHGGGSEVPGGDPFPPDGWKRHGSRWVADTPHGYYSIGVGQFGAAWYVTGVEYCSR